MLFCTETALKHPICRKNIKTEILKDFGMKTQNNIQNNTIVLTNSNALKEDFFCSRGCIHVYIHRMYFMKNTVKYIQIMMYYCHLK